MRYNNNKFILICLVANNLFSCSLDSIKGILSAAFDRVNLDLTFVSDEPTSQGTMTTTSYILLWMLAIEIMGRCSPEVCTHVIVHICSTQQQFSVMY